MTRRVPAHRPLDDMYTPRQFEESRTDVLHRFIREHPLATLVIQAGGVLAADHVPLTLRPAAAPHGRLLGHVARANPLWQATVEEVNCLAVFHGPQHYISPNWYASKAQTGKVVPTWNYEVVHVHGKIRSIDDAAWLRSLLEELTEEHERGMAVPWKIGDAPDEYIDRMLQAVVGVEVEIVRIEGKAKLSQNQPPENRRSLIDALRAIGDAGADAMADAVQARSGVGSSES